MAYTTQITTYGAAAIAAAIAAGTTLKITHMSVGDGNGAEIVPSAAATALKRETWRGLINGSSSSDNRITVEGSVPAASGGYTIREIGLWDSAGKLVAISSFPATDKPAPGNGVARETLIRVVLVVSDASAIQIVLDTSIAHPTIEQGDARWVKIADKSSQAQAEAGLDNFTWTSPLRVFQAIKKIAFLATGGTVSGAMDVLGLIKSKAMIFATGQLWAFEDVLASARGIALVAQHPSYSIVARAAAGDDNAVIRFDADTKISNLLSTKEVRAVVGSNTGISVYFDTTKIRGRRQGYSWDTATACIENNMPGQYVSLGFNSENTNATLVVHDGLFRFITGAGTAEMGVSFGTPDASSNGPFGATTSWVRTLHASDRRLKSELEEVHGVLVKLSGIQTYTFAMKGQQGRRLGTIAQDWQSCWPEVVEYITYDGEAALGINPLSAIAILVQAVNELAAEVKALRQEVSV